MSWSYAEYEKRDLEKWDFSELWDELGVALKERDEARALASWFFQEVVAPWGFKKDIVKGLRKRFPWLKVPVQQPILDQFLQEVEDR